MTRLIVRNVDWCCTFDDADMLGDLRLAARELLRAATRGSADRLGRPALGRIVPGARADLAAWDLMTVDRVGVHDPVAGLLLSGLSSHASLVVVDGEVLVEGAVCPLLSTSTRSRPRPAPPLP